MILKQRNEVNILRSNIMESRQTRSPSADIVSANTDRMSAMYFCNLEASRVTIFRKTKSIMGNILKFEGP